MIHYVVTTAHRYTVDRYLATWGRRLARDIKVVPYERLRHCRWFAPGVYVFTDTDRIGPPDRALAAYVADALAAAGNTVFNHPARVLSRLELLRRLHEAGRNDFTAAPAADAGGLRFPAFLRVANDHAGALTPPLDSAAELAAARAALPMGVPSDQLIAVEFVDTRDAEGVYRKYSVHRVGDRFIPRHVMFTRNWVGKHAQLIGPEHLAAEIDFLDSDSWLGPVREAFDLAGVEYGRIDFGYLGGLTGGKIGGRMQVWEINTNPSIAPEIDRLPPARFDAVQRSVGGLTDALADLSESTAGDACTLAVPAARRREFGLIAGDAVRGLTARAWRRVVRGRSAGRLVSRVADWYDRYV